MSSQYTDPLNSQQSTGYSYTTPATSQPIPTQPLTPEPSQYHYPISSTSTSQQQQQPAGSSSQPQSRQAAEEARKDRTLAEFLLMLDEYEPLIPNEVTDYYLQRVGFDCEDVRLVMFTAEANTNRKRLLSLAAQKFVSDIAADAYQHARLRTNTSGGRARSTLLGPSARDKTRTTLTMDDLSAALAEYGINARKPEFYL